MVRLVRIAPPQRARTATDLGSQRTDVACLWTAYAVVNDLAETTPVVDRRFALIPNAAPETPLPRFLYVVSPRLNLGAAAK